MNNSIILVSGGMDSCIAASIAKSKGDSLSFLHINYGQLTEIKELDCFNKIADYYRVDNRLIIDISHLKKIGGSCLTDSTIQVPNANLDSMDIPVSYVPFRNANILSIATSWAEVINASSIYIGAVEEDSSGYPDCRREFYDAFEKCISTGTKPSTKIKILTPLINLSKEEIVLKGNKLDAPLHLTWSCYKSNTTPCMECDSCYLRKKGFDNARITDPIEV
mgnify:CR=1 FL=1